MGVYDLEAVKTVTFVSICSHIFFFGKSGKSGMTNKKQKSSPCTYAAVGNSAVRKQSDLAQTHTWE